ncbi:hypothetical protein FLAG1_11980 [Fusarium langsethiae]|uniref:Uncharacterized protein n=1 Tax=Fusarium langsethiae TaxID=179993 RepID=A0A0M9EL61_FUSLA|nr:hypothetical protein FLAG1_11980 [Fusarium langsethiae]GKU15943.1 unnamed protein product [Fusarium langsethiae]
MGNDNGKKKTFYIELLSQETTDDILRVWRKYSPSDNHSVPHSHNHSDEGRCWKKTSNDQKDILQRLLVSALAKYMEEIPLDTYLERGFDDVCSASVWRGMKHAAVSKLYGQFVTQSFAAHQNWGKSSSGLPTICLNFVPGRIPSSVFLQIMNDFKPAYKILERKSRESSGQDREDSWSANLITLCENSDKEEGAQWRRWDDEYKAPMDVVDCTSVDVKRYNQNGPSEHLPLKIGLGSVDSSQDGQSNKRDVVHNGSHAQRTGRQDPSYLGWRACPCRTETVKQDTLNPTGAPK